MVYRLFVLVTCLFLAGLNPLSAQGPSGSNHPLEGAQVASEKGFIHVETPFFAPLDGLSLRQQNHISASVFLGNSWFFTETMVLDGRRDAVLLPLFAQRSDLVHHVLDTFDFHDVQPRLEIRVNHGPAQHVALEPSFAGAFGKKAFLPAQTDREYSVSSSLEPLLNLIAASGLDYNQASEDELWSVVHAHGITADDDAPLGKVTNTSCHSVCSARLASCRANAENGIERIECTIERRRCDENCGILPPSSLPTYSPSEFYISTGNENGPSSLFRFRYSNGQITNFTSVATTNAWITDIAQSPTTRELFAISSSGRLYKLVNNSLITVGETGQNDTVALEFCGSALYGWTYGRRIFQVNQSSADVSQTWSSPYRGSGDLMCSLRGILYGVAKENDGDYLVKHYRWDHQSTKMGKMSSSSVWGAVIDQRDNMYAVRTIRNTLRLYSVHPETGAMTLLASIGLPTSQPITGMTTTVIAI